MIRLQTTIFIIFVMLTACSEKKNVKPEELKTMTFAELVDTSKIENVEMHNNSGKFDLNPDQLKKFKNEIAEMTWVRGMSIYTGNIYMMLTINGRNYGISGRTHGEYVEADKEMVTKNSTETGDASTLVFETNGINFDNYKKGTSATVQ